MQEYNLIITAISVFILLDVLIVFYIFWKRKSKSNRFNHSFYQTHWRSIQNTAQFAPAQAILEADKLFDHAMKDLGYQGTFVDKFKKLQFSVSQRQPIWDAHKLRNRIAHEPGAKVKSAQTHINAFARGLRDLGVQI